MMLPAEEIDAVRAVLIELQRQGPSRRRSTVIAELQKKLRVSEPVAEEYLEAMLGNGVEIASGAKMLTICLDLPPDPEAANAAQWAERICGLPPHIKPWVNSPPRAIHSLPPSDALALVTCLSKLSPCALPGEDRYIWSANMIMGSSKALDAFPGLHSGIKGDNDCPDRPLFLVTAGPADPRAVLFVENPSAFGSLLRTEFVKDHLLICTFGYGLSIENLPQRLRDRRIIPCSAAGEHISDLATLIDSKPCFHWGDLDWEGLRIFEDLQEAVPHLQIPAIYHEMVNRLRDPLLSHPYSDIFGKAGQRPPKARGELVRMLADACAERSVDQEGLCPIQDTKILITPF